MFVDGAVRGLFHVRGYSPGSSNNCLYQTMFYISRRKGILFFLAFHLYKNLIK